jgi:hypothetical protein
MTEPLLAVYLIPSDRWINLFDMVVRNLGSGAACNIKWKIEADLEDLKKHEAYITDIALFDGLSYLPPGEKIQFFFGTATTLLKEPRMKPFKIAASCKNARGEICPEVSFSLDVALYKGLSQVGKPPQYEIADALKKLSEDFHKIVSRDSRLKVQTTTEEQLAEQESKWREEVKNEQAARETET